MSSLEEILYLALGNLQQADSYETVLQYLQSEWLNTHEDLRLVSQDPQVRTVLSIVTMCV